MEMGSDALCREMGNESKTKHVIETHGWTRTEIGKGEEQRNIKAK